MAMSLRVVVPPHPLIGHWLAMLRQRETPSALYATAMQELGRWLTYEALRDWLPHRQERIPTEQGEAESTVVEAGIPLLALPILPAGLELWQGGRHVLPDAALCLDGVPNDIAANTGVILFVDQISDGEGVLKVMQLLQEQGVDGRRIRLITALCASPGLKRLGETVPDLTLHTACIDESLNADGAIVPGIGDPVQRLRFRSAGRD